MSPMLVIRRLGHRAKGVILRVQWGGGHDIIALIVRNMGSALRYFHAPTYPIPAKKQL